MAVRGWSGGAIGLNVHRGFCVVAICEDRQVRSGARVASTPDGLALWAASLMPSDRVALEVTGSCWEVARILAPRVERMVVVRPDDTGITRAWAKTDRLDRRHRRRQPLLDEPQAGGLPRPGPEGPPVRGGAGAPTRKGKPSGVWVTHERMRQAERQPAAQAQASYERMVRDCSAASPPPTYATASGVAVVAGTRAEGLAHRPSQVSRGP
jgi:hypothetical protein